MTLDERTIHARNFALLALLAALVLAAVDVRIPIEVRAPVAIFFLFVALVAALHDPIHSFWVTHRGARKAHAISRAPRRARPHVDRTRASRPGWL